MIVNCGARAAREWVWRRAWRALESRGRGETGLSGDREGGSQDAQPARRQHREGQEQPEAGVACPREYQKSGARCRPEAGASPRAAPCRLQLYARACLGFRGRQGDGNRLF